MVNLDKLFGGIYNGRRVLLTGHTGFKGSWLAFWLQKMGAQVFGYALEAPSDPDHFSLLDLEIEDHTGDVRDLEQLKTYIRRTRPEIVFHLAAQSLVRPSYQDPVATFSTNFMGTLNVLEACRESDSVRAIVNITSDKCYENREWIWGYRENDPMGGYDPYSASKGTAELLTASYRNSFFHPEKYGSGHDILLASARAGNVIGGGDWAEDRLIPDIVRAASMGQPTVIRNPLATRPWQHVLEPLSGYLTLGWRLLEGHKEMAEGWNFGPDLDSNIPVSAVLTESTRHWSAIAGETGSDPEAQHEAMLLMLDCSKAHKLLHWHPVWPFATSIEKTVSWYRDYYENGMIRTKDHLWQYVSDAQKTKAVWTM